MKLFKYSEQHTELLSLRDERLGNFILSRGHVRREVFADFFSGLCYNIVNQQLSMKACETLWNKLTAALGEISPQNCTSVQQLKACGLSGSKAFCIAECARLASEGELSCERLSVMSDEQVIEQLTKIKGIGRWTAEMVLIFCLERMDVLSLSDYGVRKGLSLLHDIDIKDIKAMQKYRELYSPYGTVASIYLWEAAALLPKKEK